MDHVGYAVSDINKSLKIFLDLGYKKLRDVIVDEHRHIKIAFLRIGNLKVELISPTDDMSPVKGYLKKNGNTPYHICYRVDNLDETIEILRKFRFKVIEKANTSIALDNKKIAFLYHIDYGLLELVEYKRS